MDVVAFRSNAIFDTLRNINAQIANLASGLKQQEPTPRLEQAIHAIERHLKNVDPELLSEQVLNNCNAHLANVYNELVNAASNGNIAHLHNGVSQVDAALMYAGQMPPIVSVGPQSAKRLRAEAVALVDGIRSVESRARADISEAVNRVTVDVQRHTTQASDAARETLARLVGLEGEARSLLAALGADSSAGSYAEASSHERSQADWWRRLTLVLGAVASLIAIVGVLLLRDRSMANILTRMSLATAPSLLAIYASRQAAGHRQEERNIRQLQLQFASLSPYLADLPPERRADIKGQLTAELFRNSRPHISSSEELPNGSELLRLALAALARGK